MLRFNWMAGFVALIGGVVLATQMQNCSGSSDRLSRVPASLSSESDIIQFASNNIILESSVEKHVLTGTCLTQLDAQLKLEWDFVANDGTRVSQGTGVCDGGTYKAEITGLDKLSCQTAYWVKTSASSSSALFETQVQVTKDCPAISRLPAVATKGRTCYFELRDFAAGNQCVHTCYINGVSDEIRIVEKEKCGRPQMKTSAKTS